VGATNALLLPFPELTEAADGPDAFSDLANAVEDYVYDRILPAGVTRYLPHHWGSGATLPTTVLGARDGDTYFHTGLACSMRLTNGSWRQLAVSDVANTAARVAISTNYPSLIYSGFRVREVDNNRVWEWTGVFWKIISPLPIVSAYQTVDRLAGQSWTQVICDTVRYDPWGQYNAGLGVFGAPVTGMYRIAGVVAHAANATGGRGAVFQTRPSSAGALSYMPGTAQIIPASGGTLQTVVATPSTLVALTVGQQLLLYGYQNSTANLNQVGSVAGQQCAINIELVEQTA